MTVFRTKRFHPSTDRYAFDVGVCSTGKGWAQMDTSQDASYYGQWCNPTARKLVSFVEGDIYVTRCQTDTEFVAEVRKVADFAAEYAPDGWRGLDPGFSDELEARLVAIGLADLLHRSSRHHPDHAAYRKEMDDYAAETAALTARYDRDDARRAAQTVRS